MIHALILTILCVFFAVVVLSIACTFGVAFIQFVLWRRYVRSRYVAPAAGQFWHAANSRWAFEVVRVTDALITIHDVVCTRHLTFDQFNDLRVAQGLYLDR